MKKKNLTLKDVDVSYDPETGGISLTSRDKVLSGKPFKVNIFSDSPTYKTLMTILQARSLIDYSEVTIASSLRIDSPAATDVPDKDERTHIRIGETFNAAPVELDLGFSPHTLIVGSTGSGKSILERAIISHGLSHETIEVWGIDLARIEFERYFTHERSKLAVNLEEANKLLFELDEELFRRYTYLEKTGLHYLDTDLKAIYLVVDQLDYLLALEGVKTNEGRLNDSIRVVMIERIERLLSRGRAAGVHLFLAAQRPDSTVLTGAMKANIDTRILMGRANSTVNMMTFGSPTKFGSELLKTRGRGIVQIHGKQQLLQAYFYPLGSY